MAATASRPSEAFPRKIREFDGEEEMASGDTAQIDVLTARGFSREQAEVLCETIRSTVADLLTQTSHNRDGEVTEAVRRVLPDDIVRKPYLLDALIEIQNQIDRARKGMLV